MINEIIFPLFNFHPIMRVISYAGTLDSLMVRHLSQDLSIVTYHHGKMF